MDYFETRENEISNNFITINFETTDMYINEHENSMMLISTFREWIDSKVSPEVIGELNFTINQGLVWENILEFDSWNIRKTFNFDLFSKRYNFQIPQNYEMIKNNNSIIEAGITEIPIFLKTKYPDYDFNPVLEIAERLQTFSNFNLLFKLLNMFESLIPITIKCFVDSILSDLDANMKAQDRYNILREKSYLGLIWNHVMNTYLSKCDVDLYNSFNSQSWAFSSGFILKNL